MKIVNKQSNKTKIPSKILKIIFSSTNEISKIDKDIKRLENRPDYFKNESGKGLKMVTPQQMLTRLPFFLAQLQMGNNSKKFNNDIRQLLNPL